MSIATSLRQASLHSLNLFFGALGGVLGMIVMAITSGWLPVGVGIGFGLYVALFLAYHNIQSDLAALRLDLDVKAKNKAVVEGLLPPLHYAVHELYNFVTDSQDQVQIANWRPVITKWEHETKDLMGRLGCTNGEIASF